LPPGSGSPSVTLLALPGPPLLTVTVKPIGSPALTDAASAVLVTVRLGALTRMLAVPVLSALLLALPVAVLAYVPALLVLVALVTSTLLVAPLAGWPTLQPRLFVGSFPVTAQVPGPGYAVLVALLIPLPPGSVSLSVTLLALPGPPL